MIEFQSLKIDEIAVGAVCSCMRCKADRYDSISMLNHHRAKVIERMQAALIQIDTLATCSGVVDPAVHASMLENIYRIARKGLHGDGDTTALS